MTLFWLPEACEKFTKGALGFKYEHSSFQSLCQIELVITFWFNWRSNESISVKITCEFQVNGFYKWKSQNWNVHVNNQSSPGFISWNQFFGIIFTKSQIIAIIFIRFVCTIKICIAFVTGKDENKKIWILGPTKFKL